MKKKIRLMAVKLLRNENVDLAESLLPYTKMRNERTFVAFGLVCPNIEINFFTGEIGLYDILYQVTSLSP